MAQLMANVYFTEYSVSDVEFLCFIYPLGHIWQPSVHQVHVHSNHVVLALLIKLQPCVRRISTGVSCLECIVAEPSLCYYHEIRYQKHLFSERLSPVLNSFRSKS